jgi:REP element-mobilizing transposase RayT
MHGSREPGRSDGQGEWRVAVARRGASRRRGWCVRVEGVGLQQVRFLPEFRGHEFRTNSGDTISIIDKRMWSWLCELMARLARVVAPGFPHHITQRGNRRQQTFFCDEVYQRYVDLIADWCNALEVEMLAYCLMPNHVHLIAVPQSADGLGRAIGEAHRRYTRMINFRERWRGHLWQWRFASFVLDERTDSFPIASSTARA